MCPSLVIITYCLKQCFMLVSEWSLSPHLAIFQQYYSGDIGFTYCSLVKDRNFRFDGRMLSARLRNRNDRNRSNIRILCTVKLPISGPGYIFLNLGRGRYFESLIVYKRIYIVLICKQGMQRSVLGIYMIRFSEF